MPASTALEVYTEAAPPAAPLTGVEKFLMLRGGTTYSGEIDDVKEYIVAVIADSAPATLDTLNELAAALGDDANFAATVATALGQKAPLASAALTGTPTAPTAGGGTNTTQIATTAFVQAAIAALIASAPGALDTLGELAAALGDDSNFAATVTTALAGKAPSANPTFTGTVAAPTPSAGDNSTKPATTAFLHTMLGQTATLSNDVKAVLAAPDAAGVRSAIGVGAGTGDVVAANDLSDLAHPRTTALANIFPVGAVMDYAGSSAPTGWLLSDGRTIGDAASGGTAAASAGMSDLFTLLWNSFANAQLPIQDSAGGASTRGASAAADFAAHKRLPLPDYRGRVGVGKDDMSGSAANRITSGNSGITGTTLGAAGGDERMHQHTHTASTTANQLTGAVSAQAGANYGVNNGAATVTVNNAGSGAAQNVQPSIVINKIIFAGA